MSKWTRANPLAAVPGYKVPAGHFANGYTNGGDRVGFKKIKVSEKNHSRIPGYKPHPHGQSPGYKNTILKHGEELKRKNLIPQKKDRQLSFT